MTLTFGKNGIPIGAATLGGGDGVKFEVVTELPQEGKAGIIYLLQVDGAEAPNKCEEYIWLKDEGRYEEFGPTTATPDKEGIIKFDPDSLVINDDGQLTVDGYADLKAKVDDLELFKFPNATIVGEPLINNGQIANFSTADYLMFPFELDVRDHAFTVEFAFTTSDDVTTQQNVIDSRFGIALAIKNGLGLMAVSYNGTSWGTTGEGVMAIQPNTTYYAKLTWNKLQYKTLLSTNGRDYVEDISFTSATGPFPATIFIGGGSTEALGHEVHPFKGTINLNKAYVYIDNQLIWQGMDDVGLATRLDVELGNITSAGIQAIQNIVGNPYSKTEIDEQMEEKQDVLTPGDAIKYIAQTTTKIDAAEGISISGQTYSYTNLVAMGEEKRLTIDISNLHILPKDAWTIGLWVAGASAKVDNNEALAINTAEGSAIRVWYGSRAFRLGITASQTYAAPTSASDRGLWIFSHEQDSETIRCHGPNNRDENNNFSSYAFGGYTSVAALTEFKTINLYLTGNRIPTADLAASYIEYNGNRYSLAPAPMGGYTIAVDYDTNTLNVTTEGKLTVIGGGGGGTTAKAGDNITVAADGTVSQGMSNINMFQGKRATFGTTTKEVGFSLVDINITETGATAGILPTYHALTYENGELIGHSQSVFNLVTGSEGVNVTQSGFGYNVALDGTLTECQVVIETFYDPASGSGYRVWSDGYCEQQGLINVSASGTSLIAEAYFLKTFKDSNYNRSALVDSTGNARSINYGADPDHIRFIINSSSSIYVANLTWRASGYLAEGEY